MLIVVASAAFLNFTIPGRLCPFCETIGMFLSYFDSLVYRTCPTSSIHLISIHVISIQKIHFLLGLFY